MDNIETYLGASGARLIDKHGDDQLAIWISLAQEQVERFLGYVLEDKIVTDEPVRLYSDRRGGVWFGCRYKPVKTFVSADWIVTLSGARQAVDTTFLYLEPSKAVGRIALSWAAHWVPLGYSLHVSYVAGQPSDWIPPSSVLYALALLVQELAEDSASADSAAGRAPGGPLSGFKMGDYSEQYEVSWSSARPADLGLGTLLSIRAARLLAPLAAPAVQITGTPYR